MNMMVGRYSPSSNAIYMNPSSTWASSPSSSMNAVNQSPKKCWTCGSIGHVSSQCYRNPHTNSNNANTSSSNNNRSSFSSSYRGVRGGSTSNRGGHGIHRQGSQ